MPHESVTTAPLRNLLKKDAKWDWQPEHDQAIDKLKKALTSNPVLAFYDVTRPVTIQADASQSGLGACLLHRGQRTNISHSETVGREGGTRFLEPNLAFAYFDIISSF